MHSKPMCLSIQDPLRPIVVFTDAAVDDTSVKYAVTLIVGTKGNTAASDT